MGDDIYGAAMLEAGVPLATIKVHTHANTHTNTHTQTHVNTHTTVEAWSADPSVEFEGRPQSLFDLLEDLDAKAGLQKAQKILG